MYENHLYEKFEFFFILTISILPNIDFQLSEISPVVRQLLPTLADQRAGSSTPHSKIELF